MRHTNKSERRRNVCKTRRSNRKRQSLQRDREIPSTDPTPFPPALIVRLAAPRGMQWQRSTHSAPALELLRTHPASCSSAGMHTSDDADFFNVKIRSSSAEASLLFPSPVPGKALRGLCGSNVLHSTMAHANSISLASITELSSCDIVVSLSLAAHPHDRESGLPKSFPCPAASACIFAHFCEAAPD